MMGRLISICLWLILVLHLVFRIAGNAEVEVLNALRTHLGNSNDVFQSWNTIEDNPCRWYHITCDNQSSVTRVDLGNANLSGQLVPQLGQLTNLQYLDLSSNNIYGIIPDDLVNLINLVSLDLYSNVLTGLIPTTLDKLTKLRFLRLNNNSLTGQIPTSLTAIDTLQVLDLSNNKLVGDIPVNGSFANFQPISFANNRLNNPPPAPPPPIFFTSTASTSSGNSSIGFIAGGVAAGAALIFAIVIAWWLKRKPLDNLSDVPVKRLKEGRTQGGELQFQTEVELISMAVHRNLLRLRGFCMTPTERLLVYPFMVNGSVASCLRERSESQTPLVWDIRKQIALGAARGLAYLHDHCDPKIIHRDVKAASILLNEEFEAVVGDFGLAKLMDYKDTHVTTAVRGTIGHIAPEYLSSGKSSEKTDVFGYGVMLLELITGQRAFDLARLADDGDAMLLDWAKGLLKYSKLEMLVDSDLNGKYADIEVEQLMQVALLCTQGSPMKRPKMAEVVRMLEGDGLAERWEEWQKEDMVLQESNQTRHPNVTWIIPDSSSHIPPDELSGPR
ncbi:hypothetical protein V6N11_072449 [Hibiscus sabdariffa]|uniref:Protein kinase domain-containing protein n=1 Tax=Hibiscus sabdariffa TaxID=183260 RepID=A0ABR2U3B7_9ROSI